MCHGTQKGLIFVRCFIACTSPNFSASADRISSVIALKHKIVYRQKQLRTDAVFYANITLTKVECLLIFVSTKRFMANGNTVAPTSKVT
jgi:hypothetical protein